MGLALLQILVTIPVLIVALVIVETQFPQWAPPLRSDSPIILFGNPRFQVHIENIWFIVYEIWKLWLAIDGVTWYSCIMDPLRTRDPFLQTVYEFRLTEERNLDNSLELAHDYRCCCWHLFLRCPGHHGESLLALVCYLDDPDAPP